MPLPPHPFPKAPVATLLVEADKEPVEPFRPSYMRLSYTVIYETECEC